MSVSVVKGIEIKIDYVEFDDKTHLGSDEKGSKAITELRRGAVGYKNWLVEKYISNNKSIENVAQFLENDKPLPEALRNSSKYEQYGAKTYRNRLREIYLKQGVAQIEKYLGGDSNYEK